MLQRTQSLFFLLAAIFTALLFFVPFGMVYEGNIFIYYTAEDNPAILALTVIALLLSLVNIFLYKNRSLQMKIAGLTMVILFADIIAMLFHINVMTDDFYNKLITNSYIGSLLALMALVSTYLAYFYVRKDEKLVRSADRFR